MLKSGHLIAIQISEYCYSYDNNNSNNNNNDDNNSDKVNIDGDDDDDHVISMKVNYPILRIRKLTIIPCVFLSRSFFNV